MNKKSPFVRIREKNLEIKDLKLRLDEVAQLLGCDMDGRDIPEALIEALQWKRSYMVAMEENDAMMVKMGETISQELDKLSFKLQLENKQLQAKVEKLQSILDTKVNDTQKVIQKTQTNQKGFWDFLYKVFGVV